ncbi:MAG: enoyl-CoA hydratase-related protein [Pseudomonadales bacterium]
MSIPQLTDCQLEVSNKVAVLKFDRNDVLNALTGTAIADDLVETVAWLNQQNDVQVLILTGNGRAFSAGGNVKDMAERKNEFAGNAEELAARYQAGIQRIPLAMASLELPAIAAVNGPAIGAGFDLVNMCDMAIASDRARFGETFVNLGIIPGDGGAWFLPRKIGMQRAAELTYSGRIIDAKEALKLGVILEHVPADNLLEHALSLAASIACKPAFALRQSKRLLQASPVTPLPEFLQLCAQIQGQCHQKPEHMEAVLALLDKMSSAK